MENWDHLHSFILLLLSCCITYFQPSSICQTDGLHLTQEYVGIQTSSWWTQWLQGAQFLCCQTSPNHHHITTVVGSWYELFVLIFCMFFSPNLELCIKAEHLHFVCHVCLKDIFPEVSWFVQMQLYKPKIWCHVVLVRRDFLLASGSVVYDLRICLTS